MRNHSRNRAHQVLDRQVWDDELGELSTNFFRGRLRRPIPQRRHLQKAETQRGEDGKRVKRVIEAKWYSSIFQQVLWGHVRSFKACLLGAAWREVSPSNRVHLLPLGLSAILTRRGCQVVANGACRTSSKGAWNLLQLSRASNGVICSQLILLHRGITSPLLWSFPSRCSLQSWLSYNGYQSRHYSRCSCSINREL